MATKQILGTALRQHIPAAHAHSSACDDGIGVLQFEHLPFGRQGEINSPNKRQREINSPH